MNKHFKITPKELENLNKISQIRKSDCEIIDLTELNVFDTAKAIIMISSYRMNNHTKNYKYKISAPNIENFLKNIPISTNFELVL